jgi:hypothetical protein
VKVNSMLALCLAGLLMFVPTRSRSQGPEADPPFGFDDLMTMLIQPRHIKLYYAGVQKNWELAAAQSRDLRSALVRIEQKIPKYMNNDVAESINMIFMPKLNAVDAAISAGDPRQFGNAYLALTDACNACHVYMEHPYIVVQIPRSRDTSAYPGQVFRQPRVSP